MILHPHAHRCMLVVFECTVVSSRLRNIDELRELATPPSAVYALRGGAWVALSSEELLPGDLVGLARAPPTARGERVETLCPADVLLLHGTLALNESARADGRESTSHVSSHA